LTMIGLACISIILAVVYPDKFTAQQHLPPIVFFGMLCGSSLACSSLGMYQIAYWEYKRPVIALSVFHSLACSAPGLITFFIPLVVSEKPVRLFGAYGIWLCLLTFAFLFHYFVGRDSSYYQLIEFIRRSNHSKPRNEIAMEAERIAKTYYAQSVFPKSDLKVMLRASLTQPHTWALSYLYFVSFGGFLALTCWLPTFFKNTIGSTSIEAGYLTGIFSLFVVIFKIPSAFVAEKIGLELFGILSMLMLILSSFFLIFSHLIGLSVVGGLLLSVGLGGNNAVVNLLFRKYFSDNQAGAFGWISTAGTLGGFINCLILGAIAFYPYGYWRGFGLFAAHAIMSIIIYIILWVKRDYQDKDIGINFFL